MVIFSLIFLLNKLIKDYTIDGFLRWLFLLCLSNYKSGEPPQDFVPDHFSGYLELCCQCEHGPMNV